MSKLEKDLKKARAGAADAEDLVSQARDVGGVKLLAARIDAPDRKTLGEWAEKYRDKLGSAVVLLAAVIDEKVVLIAAVTKALTPQINAGAIVREASVIVGGKGGGRPDFAQGGGTDATKIDEALKCVEELIGS